MGACTRTGDGRLITLGLAGRAEFLELLMGETSRFVAVQIHPLIPTTNAEEPVVSVKNSDEEQAELRDKLVLAAELPSAAEALAELFPDESILAGAVANMETPSADSAAPNCAEVDKKPSRDISEPPQSAPHASSSPSDWALEEALAGHREWVESQGTSGTRADLSAAKLEGADLISVKLRSADLSSANLKGADLLLADLRDACLVRANLQESCLVGANLEGANLENASLETAMGLVPRQLAGANLHEATLPSQLLEFSALAEFEQASRTSMRFFGMTLSLSLLSWLIVWVTKDVQLLGDTAIIPFLHSPAAAAALPTVEFYLIAPVLLCIFYLVFLFQLQRVWDSVLELPAIFPDGRALGSSGPRIVLGLLRTHFRWTNQDPPSTRVIEKAISVFLAYWIVPATLLLYWARYLTLQEMHGTILHVLLFIVATGAAVYATIRIGRPQERWTEGKSGKDISARLRNVKPLPTAIGLGLLLTVVSIGVFTGVPHDASRAPQIGPANIRRWAPTAFSWVGFDPYANLTEAVISNKPAGWTGEAAQVPSVKGARLNNTKFRYAQAYGVFLVNAHLWRSDFEGSFLSQADMRGADLSQSNLRFATMDRIQLNHANLDRANLDGANLARADLRDANLSYATLVDATLVDARLDGASFYGAKLPSANLVRAGLERTDLRSAHLENANLEHADFQQAYLWATALSGANLKRAQLQTAIFIDADLRGADLREAQFSGTVLNGADLSGSNLDGADLRGALQLSAYQICSAKSRQGTMLDEAMQAQVDAQCGVPH